MIRNIYLGNVLLTTPAWNVETMPFSVPERRGENIVIPYRDGARHTGRKPFNQRVEVLNMWIIGVNVDGILPPGVTEREQLELNVEYLKSIFSLPGQVSFRVQMLDGTYRVAQVEITSVLTIFKERETVSARMSVELRFADPFYYGETLVTETIELTSGSVSAVLTNVGTAHVKKGTIKITGIASNIKINNTTNEISCTYTGILANGVEAIIDLTNQKVTVNDENYLGFLIHLGDPSWFTLNPGTNAMEITCDTFGGSVEISYYPAYI
jgi:hypothetical protein